MTEQNIQQNEAAEAATEAPAEVPVEAATEVAAEPISIEPTPELGMKWYKFLIYFSLFAGAVLNIITAVPYLKGTAYDTFGTSSSLVYRTFPGLRAIDIVYGIVMVVLAALCIYTRFRLSGYRKNGPVLLFVMYGINAVFSVIYPIAAGAVTGLNLFDASIVSSIITSVLMIVLNKIYFDKRKHLFVN